MEFLTKIERKVLGWFKTVPNLPSGARAWLGDNVWWIAIIGAILTGLSILFNLATLSAKLSQLGTTSYNYYVSSTYASWEIITISVGLVFSILEVLLLIAAIQALKQKQKKGWVLLFAAWLLSAIAVVVSGLLTLSILGFIITVLFGAIGIAVVGYFLFEIHGEFAHVERSKGVQKDAKIVK